MPRTRPAMTLVEMLVVVAIIGVLIALLLPAVQAVRESARQVQCRNHLHQLALAGLQYHEIHDVFPTSVSQFSFRERFEDVDTWLVKLLPFLEQTALHSRWKDANLRRDRREILNVTETAIATTYCPSRRAAIAYPLPNAMVFRAGSGRVTKGEGARTDYAINGGAARHEGGFGLDIKGVWSPDESIGAADIYDGLSNTYYVGEKAMDGEHYTTGFDLGDQSSIYHCRTGSCIRFAKNRPVRDPMGKNTCVNCHDFGSAHPSSWNVALCDGSVQAISYDISFDVHRNFATRDNLDDR